MNNYNIGDAVYSKTLEKVIIIQGILGSDIVHGICSKESMLEIQNFDKDWQLRALYLYKAGFNEVKLIPESDLIREESLMLNE